MFGLEIKFYGIIMALAFIFATIICIYIFKKKKYYEELPYTLLLIVFPCSIFGARLYYVLFQSNVSYTIGEFFAIWNGGLAIYGGIIGGLIAIAVYCIIKKINLLTILDVVAPCVVFAQALGRWGNFFNQEAHGGLIPNPNLQYFPYGVLIDGSWFQATFFYESFWNFLTFFVLMFIILKSDKQGISTGVYLFLYGLARIYIEGLRTDSLIIGSTGIRVSQVISGFCIIIGITLCVLALLGKMQATDKSKPFKENLFVKKL